MPEEWSPHLSNGLVLDCPFSEHERIIHRSEDNYISTCCLELVNTCHKPREVSLPLERYYRYALRELYQHYVALRVVFDTGNCVCVCVCVCVCAECYHNN